MRAWLSATATPSKRLALTQTVLGAIPSAHPYPLVMLAKTRRSCSSCRRKTRWLFHYGDFLRVRICAKCMTPDERAAFVEQYGAFLRGFRINVKTGGERY